MDMEEWRNHSAYNESFNSNYTNIISSSNITETVPQATVTELDINIGIDTQLKLIFEGYGVTIFSILGIILNTLSIIVFLQRGMRSISINILLLGLQISDLLVVISLLYISGLPPLFKLDLSGYMSMLIVALGNVGKTGSHYFTILVSVERYIAVCHPLKVKLLCSPYRAIAGSVIVAVFSILISLPHFLQLPWTAWILVEIVLIPSIPFLVLIYLNLAIYDGFRKSQKANSFLRRSGGREEGDQSLTLLLFCMVVVYLFCNTFYLIEYLGYFFGFYNNWFLRMFVRRQTDFFLTVNSATNFLFYCAYGKKFRGELKKVFGLDNLVKPQKVTDITSVIN